MVQNLMNFYGQRNLCMAGGVALNCLANGKILKADIAEKIWIQPAAGDAGGTLGAALGAYYMHFKGDRTPPFTDQMQGALLGPAFSDEEIFETLKRLQINFQKMLFPDLLEKCAQDLENGKVLGWFQGRMEFGPRALGSRSILTDSRQPETQQKLNFASRLDLLPQAY
jgi:carbamoyltransferase